MVGLRWVRRGCRSLRTRLVFHFGSRSQPCVHVLVHDAVGSWECRPLRSSPVAGRGSSNKKRRLCSSRGGAHSTLERMLPPRRHTAPVSVPLPAVILDGGGGMEGSRRIGHGCRSLSVRLPPHHGSKPQPHLHFLGRTYDAVVSQKV
ncbi:hypothetical protein NDU88_003467 [Pleurodeles waltl]|uniref:Uncharacterized protein n=1 Tax=Pleurodeles waltl TaxID=8319 RepID=A0AAV7WSW6_PLEWA|nr:hypothetical protein NDU88_003467 [Pleurodeles waltl]